MIGFCGAPFTLASYMIEGGGSRNYIEVKKMMYNQPQVWDELLGKLNVVLAAYMAEQVKAGADVIQVFDSWVGCLSVEDYRTLRSAAHQGAHLALKEDGRADHLFRHRQHYPAAFDERNRSRSHRPGLAGAAR